MPFKDPLAFKFFLDSCLEEINTCGRCGSGLRPGSWYRIMKKLQDNDFKITMTQKQLRNAWDYNKKKYKVWSDMVIKSIHGFNPVTNTMDWPDEEWDSYIKDHPDARKFRKVGLQYPNVMRTLFDHTSATRVIAVAPMSVHPRLADCVSESSTPEAANLGIDGLACDESGIDPLTPDSINMETSNSSSSRKRPRQTMGYLEEHICNFIAKMDSSFILSVIACNEKLKEMELPQNDPPLHGCYLLVY